MDKKETKIKECDTCGKNSTSLCFKCLEYFCDECYKYVHDKQINSNHKKEEIDIYVPIDLKCQDHPEVPLNLFCLDEKELCCAYCLFKNLHSEHKLLELSNIESFEKENINIESSAQEFGGIIEKTISLKNKIEKEINNINILYEKTMKDLISSFVQKHEKLIKIENNLKEQLQFEITKVKEKLENFWSRVNNQIKMNERINQGIKKIKKEEGKNMIRTLTYISKINKNKKEMNSLLTELMKSIKFTYQEEESIIKYEEFCFNGIQTPKNIEVKDIKYNSLNISWDIDTINNININYNNIDYIIEMRKDKEKYIEVYKGKNKSCLIDKLSSNTEYEFRICSVYNDFKSLWSDSQKIKTNINSIILKEAKKGNNLLEKIFDWSGYKNMELLYRGTRDGSSSRDFHSKCDNKGPTITLFKNEKGFIFGGFTSISWTDNKGWLTAPDSFIFTLTNIHNTEPTKFNRTNNQYGVYHNIEYGAYFGNGPNIGCYSDFLKENSHFQFDSYQDNLGKGISIFTGDLNNSNHSFKT